MTDRQSQITSMVKRSINRFQITGLTLILISNGLAPLRLHKIHSAVKAMWRQQMDG
jgi:hypothetical protein